MNLSQKVDDRNVWLECQSGEGIFSHEASVMGTTADGAGFSLFVDRKHLERPQQVGPNFVRVNAIPIDGGRYQVRLPGDPFEMGQHVQVAGHQIKGAEG